MRSGGPGMRGNRSVLTRAVMACCLVWLIGSLLPSAAFAHVPWIETGPGSGPYALGSPEVSRAVYGRLDAGVPDEFTFFVERPVSTKVDLLVPVRPALLGFYPTLVITGGDQEYAARRNRDRPQFFEPFSLASFWEVASVEASLVPGVAYRLEVSDPVDAPGPYVIAFGGPEAFAEADIAETARVLPTIWLGAWGGEPVRPSAVAVLTVAAITVALTLVWVVARLVTSRANRARP